MFARILVGYDGSEGARAALSTALRLTSQSHRALTAVTVQHHLPRYGATIGEVAEEREIEAAEARRLANEIQAQADEYGVKVHTKVTPRHPAQELVRAAKQANADLVVLGHSGHSAQHPDPPTATESDRVGSSNPQPDPQPGATAGLAARDSR